MTKETTARSESYSSADQPQEKVLRVKVTPVFEANLDAKSNVVINVGGARSSKSHSIAQLLIQKFTNERRKKILVTRKTGPALYLTAYSLIISLLNQYGIYPKVRHDKTRFIVYNPANGCMFAFLSIDDPEKIKSTEWNYVWMEEANEFDWNDFIVLKTRMSGATVPEEPNQIFMSLNPSEEQGWINQKILLSDGFAGKHTLIRSTYKMNPHLSQEYIQELEDLKEQDPEAHRVYALGDYGQLTNIIYSPFIMMNSFPEALDEEFFCVDFGYNNPSAALHIGTRDLTNHYITQLIYKTKLTNGQLIELLKEKVPEKKRDLPMYCDAAEPQRIAELCSAGFNALSADKDVKPGIDLCKRQKFYTLLSNSETNKEAKTYKWKTDKNGNVLDEPVKFMDHAMDAMRYGIYTHYAGRLTGDGVRVSRV